MEIECEGPIDLKNSESKYKLLFECALDIVFLVDLKGKILDANNAATKEYGYSRKELLSLSVRDLRAPNVRDTAESQLAEGFEKGRIYETVHQRQNGTRFPVEISLRGMVLGSEKQIFAIVRDITIRRQAEQDRSRLAAIVGASGDSIVGMTLDGTITDWNYGAEKLYSYTAEEMIGRSIQVVIPEEKETELSRIIEKIKKGGRIKNLETVRRGKEGRTIYVSLTVSPILNQAKEITGLAWISRDISERKKLDEELSRRATLIDLTPDAIVARRPDGTITFWNRGAETLYGWTSKEALDKSMPELLKVQYPQPLEQISEHLQQRNEWSGELVQMAKDGRRIVVRSKWLARKDSRGQITEILESNIDITGRKQAEAALREERARLKAIIAGMTEGVIVANSAGDIVAFNSAAMHIHEFTRTDEWKKNIRDYPSTFEIFDLGGRRLPHEEWPLNRVLRGETFSKTELRVRRKDTDYDRILSYGGAPIVDSSNHIQAVVLTVRDITEMKLAEEELEEAKTQAELYVDIMGHDINNLNQVALMNLELLQPAGNLKEDQLEILGKILTAIEGSVKIIENVRKIQKITSGELHPEPVDLDSLISNCVAEAPKPPGKKVEISYSSESGKIVKGASLLKEVFCNLIHNSIKYSGPAVKIEITVEEVLEKGKAHYRTTIADDGYGISDELKQKLFRRFQRGTTEAHGKGLGLYIVRMLVERFGGEVSVEDRVPGDSKKGAKFVVLLPVLAGTASAEGRALAS